MRKLGMMVVACIGVLTLSGCVETATVVNANEKCDVGKVPTWDYRFVFYDRLDETVKYVKVDSYGEIEETYYSRDLNEIMSGEYESFILTIGKKNYPFVSPFIVQIDSDEVLYFDRGKIIHWWDSDGGVKKSEVLNIKKYINAKSTGSPLNETQSPTKSVITTNVVYVDSVITPEPAKISRSDLFNADFDTFFYNMSTSQEL